MSGSTFPPELLNQTPGDFETIATRATVVAYRCQRPHDDILDTRHRRFVPGLVGEDTFRFKESNRCRCHASEDESGPSDAPRVLQVERHRRRDGADVAEPPLRDLIEPHEGRQRLRDLDRRDDLVSLQGSPAVRPEKRRYRNPSPTDE